MTDKKIINRTQGVEAAAILFALNTEPDDVLRLAGEADLLHGDAKESLGKALCMQWYGFVHAAVVAGLMVYAPNIVVASYLRHTRYLLKGIKGQDDAACDHFIDHIFTPYMELLVSERQKECPALFFRHVCGAQSLEGVPARAAVIISGAMAMTLGTIFDTLEQYEILAE